MAIHPTALVDPRADIHPEAEIGPYVVIEGPVKIGAGTRVMAHAHISGWTEIGEHNEIHPGAVLGAPPQDTAYRGEKSFLRIGSHNVIREYVQAHRATGAASETVVGNHNFLMAGCHVGHNCRLGDHIVLVNGALLAGHVQVGDRAMISGNCVVHQFVRVGTLALMRGLSGTSRDVPPYAIVDWQHRVRGVNSVGLRRAGFDEARTRAIKNAFRILFRRGRNLAIAVSELEAKMEITPDVAALLDFIRSSKRGVCFGGD
ncbi:MAG TPA: acyl-ACP--UDP-N-acetylglucosamine O-acyltransferase [Candidatus Acidoferrales bacterium]|nr:acyl-ACP--UDP-N-acetylglucosamine O-acyltransferase [Candidatus Acidoferrales bacterium]